MSEDDVRDALRCQFGDRVEQRLARFAEMLVVENTTQNLVARSTLGELWSRHVLDSTQLLEFAPRDGLWTDIGSGGGLPGLVIAICRPAPILLIEPRRLRAEFLQRAVLELDLPHAMVRHARAESVTGVSAAVISARAVASLDRLFAMAAHLATPQTCWLLPKGASAEDEVAEAKRSWHGTFHVERSATSSQSGIVVAREVRHR